MTLQRGAGIYIRRGAELLGNRRNRYIFGVQLAVTVIKVVHVNPESVGGAAGRA
jgi:hypothetical protein